MWRKRNPHAFLVGIYIGAAPTENSMEVPQKLKIELPYNLEILGIYSRKIKTNLKRYLQAYGHCSFIYKSQDM